MNLVNAGEDGPDVAGVRFVEFGGGGLFLQAALLVLERVDARRERLVFPLFLVGFLAAGRRQADLKGSAATIGSRYLQLLAAVRRPASAGRPTACR